MAHNANPVCTERWNDQPHCWHPFSTPIQVSPTNINFPSVCCFCAPTYLHMVSLVPFTASDEDMVLEQTKHGHLVEIQRAQMKPRAPQLMVPNDRKVARGANNRIVRH